MSKMFYGGIYCQKLTVQRAIACLRWIQLLAEKRKWLPHTIQILLQNATYGDITSVTRDVYLSHRVLVYQKVSVCQYLFGLGKCWLCILVPLQIEMLTSVTVLYGLRWQLSINYLMVSTSLRIGVWNGGNNLPFLNIYAMLVAFRALRNSQWRRRRWVTAKFLRHKRGGLKNIIQFYRTDTSQDLWLFRIQLAGQK